MTVTGASTVTGVARKGFQLMEFNARVGARSSRGLGGPPGEAEVLRLNPQRQVIILQATGWTQLIQGTLNLEVAQG